MIDENGYRLNVGMIICNDLGQLLWCRRATGDDSWQFPQGGINESEQAEDAMFRELHEEVGLKSEQVEVLGSTSGWLYYDLPEHFVRRHSQPLCIGQKQRWFLLRLTAPERAINMAVHTRPEFDGWQWVSYWYPLNQVVWFKQDIYRQALQQLAPLLPGGE